MKTRWIVTGLCMVVGLCAAAWAEDAAPEETSAQVPAPPPDIASDTQSQQEKRGIHKVLRFEDAMWRVEITGAAGLHTNKRNRKDDWMGTITVEYEVPVTGRLTAGLRLLPLLVYEQHKDKTVFAAGVGTVLRFYVLKNEYRGFYAEAEAHPMGNYPRIRGNSSHFNFLTGVGVGYKCKKNFHSSLKFEHISNANIGRRNEGTNMLSLGVGYSF